MIAQRCAVDPSLELDFAPFECKQLTFGGPSCLRCATTTWIRPRVTYPTAASVRVSGGWRGNFVRVPDIICRAPRNQIQRWRLQVQYVSTYRLTRELERSLCHLKDGGWKLAIGISETRLTSSTLTASNSKRLSIAHASRFCRDSSRRAAQSKRKITAVEYAYRIGVMRVLPLLLVLRGRIRGWVLIGIPIQRKSSHRKPGVPVITRQYQTLDVTEVYRPLPTLPALELARGAACGCMRARGVSGSPTRPCSLPDARVRVASESLKRKQSANRLQRGPG